MKQTQQRFLEMTLLVDEAIPERVLQDIEHYNGILEIQSAAATPLPRPWT